MMILYTLHALERMRQRGIERGLVEACIREPDKDEGLNGLRRCVKGLNGRVLVVVYKPSGDTVIVITAFISSKARKYLGR